MLLLWYGTMLWFVWFRVDRYGGLGKLERAGGLWMGVAVLFLFFSPPEMRWF